MIIVNVEMTLRMRLYIDISQNSFNPLTTNFPVIYRQSTA